MSKQIKYEYRDFIASQRSVRMPVELLADVGSADGRHVCIARLYCWKGSGQHIQKGE